MKIKKANANKITCHMVNALEFFIHGHDNYSGYCQDVIRCCYSTSTHETLEPKGGYDVLWIRVDRVYEYLKTE